FYRGSSVALRLCRDVVRSWKDLRSRNIVRRIGSEERPDMGRQSRKAEYASPNRCQEQNSASWSACGVSCWSLRIRSSPFSVGVRSLQWSAREANATKSLCAQCGSFDLQVCEPVCGRREQNLKT